MTPDIVAQTPDVLPTLQYLETFAQWIGVDRSAVLQWLRRGREERRRTSDPRAKPRPDEAIYVEFLRAYELGMLKTEKAALEAIIKVGTQGLVWQAAAWILERRFPERWGKPEQRPADETPRKVVVQVVEEIVAAPGAEHALPAATNTDPPVIGDHI